MEPDDALTEETEKVCAVLGSALAPVQDVPFSPEELEARLHRYAALTERLRAMALACCCRGEKAQEEPWLRCVGRIAHQVEAVRTPNEWGRVHTYPALLLFYTSGIASIAASRYDTFASLLTGPTVTMLGTDQPMVLAASWWVTWLLPLMQRLPAMERSLTPVSDHLYSLLREPFRQLVPDDRRYQECFDRFEYLLHLVRVDLSWNPPGALRGPVGRFGWRHRYQGGDSIVREIESEASGAGPSWPPLQAGLFGGSAVRFREVKAHFDAFIEQLAW